MTPTSDTLTTTLSIHRVYIKATPERIWEAITSPEWNARYAYKAPSEYDLRPGGAYRVVSSPEMTAMGAPEVLIDGEVIEADPPRRLVQTWHAYFTPETDAEGPRRLTWEITEENGGICRLTVTHELDNAPHTLATVRGDAKLHEGGGGWDWILSDLKSFLESGSSLSES